MALEHIGVSTAAFELGVTPARIRVFIHSGRLKAETLEGRFLIPKTEIDRFKTIPRYRGRPKIKNSF